MLFSTFAVVMASLASTAQSAPATGPAGLVVLEQFLSKDGASTITVYGDAKRDVTIARDTDLFKRCGTNQLTCDNAHLADRNACNSLVNDLRGSGAALPGSPRSICGTYSGSQCCVSWANPVSGAVRDNLVSAAQKALDGCQGNTGVSGKTSDTLIGQTCTSQCLSNRASGC
ncbi:hypothetical protein ONZ43_g4603 [Nemania bipapillata]|uniref:Uncharacterized protein n=1 Tax=Nemania bipapillata TaxID=110536 RepID=A0ACC2IKL7_9PEZI|nr:hypothetical protein ONZ43_g4603 [Nemania bipapillata]